MRSKFTFFKRGLTSATFKSSRKVPVCKDLLTISLKRGAIFGRMSLRRVVGIGSASQVLLGDFLTITDTLSSESNLKLSMHGTTLWGKTRGGCSWTCLAVKESLILAIFVMKKLLKHSASSLSVKPGGRGRSWLLPSRLLHMAKIFLVLVQLSWTSLWK